MREIKFRVWTEVSHEWLGMKYLELKDVSTNYNNTLMQFTGLKDKNGKEIYEGDIVHVRGQKEPNFVIEYDLDRFKLGLPYANPDRASRFFLPIRKDWWTMEVIGNIYENKDLLV